MKSGLFASENGVLEYAVWGSGSEVIVLLPPGLGRMTHYTELAELLSSGYKVISVNFPGIGKSRINKPGVIATAGIIAELLRQMNIVRPLLLGESYGGDVAIRLLELTDVKALVLLASGEYFSDAERKILRFVFYPAYRLPFIRKVYSVIVKHIRIVEFRDGKDINLDQVMIRWWEILSYRLPDRMYTLPVAIFWPKKDGILRKGTLDKLSLMFPMKQLYMVPAGHQAIYRYLREHRFSQLADFIQYIENKAGKTYSPVPKTLNAADPLITLTMKPEK